MDRKNLKKKAKIVFKRNYLNTILVVFIIGLIVHGGYQFTTNITGTNNSIQKTNFQLVNELSHNIGKKTLNNKSKGVIAPIFNTMTESNSAVIGFLNSLNLYLLDKKVSFALISLIGSVIIIILKIFVQNVFIVGYKRYMLEQRCYNTSVMKIFFPFKVRKNINIGIILLFKDLYELLWSLTIIGGVIKYYEYRLIPYILAENPNIKRKEAFNLSKEMMTGLKWQYFKLDVSFIGWYILSIITFGLLDIFFLDGYKECVYAEVYMQIRIDKKTSLTYGSLLNDKYLDTGEVSLQEYPMDKYTIPVKFKKKKQQDYNVKYTIRNLILMFFTFAFVGWAWEVLLHIITEGRFVNRGTMFGPWLPIYGFGGILILIILKPVRNKPILFFICAMILAGIVEYSTAWYLETFKHLKWWDYSGYFLNIHGRVCFEGLLIFGLGGAAVTYFIGPALNDLYGRIKIKISYIICIILLTLYGIDLAYSSIHPNTGKGITDYKQNE